MSLNELFLEFNKSNGVISVDGISLGVLIHTRTIEIKDLLKQEDEVDRVFKLLELSPLDFSGFLKTMTQDLKLELVVRKGNGNVCFMGENESLRDDFKVVFYVLDVVDYVYALSFATKNLSLDIVQFSIDVPKSTTQFWSLVRLGKLIREALNGVSNLNVLEKEEILKTLTYRVDIKLI